jgi:hypothetical protein
VGPSSPCEEDATELLAKRMLYHEEQDCKINPCPKERRVGDRIAALQRGHYCEALGPQQQQSATSQQYSGPE